MSEIKQISIAGEAAATLFPTGGKRRTTRKKTSLTVNESRAPMNYEARHHNHHEHHSQPEIKAVSLQPSYEVHKEPVKESPTTIHIDNSYKVREHLENKQQEQQQQQEQQPQVKHNIILGPKKNKSAKIILSRKKKHIGTQQQQQHSKNKHKTRKVSISLAAHKKRITRARKMSKETKKLPIEKIREQLVKKGLIKQSSKAPEAVLRQMYTDAIVVAQKAL
jgi:hypothetical protein